MREVGKPEHLLDLPDLRDGILIAVFAELLALDLLELAAHLLELALGERLFPGRENDRVFARVEAERGGRRRASVFAFPQQMAALRDLVSGFVGDVFQA